ISQGAGRAQKYEPEGALGVVYRKAPGDEAAAGTTCDDGGFKMEGVHERCEVRCEIMRAIALRGATRITVAPLRQGKGVNGAGQVRQHSFKGAPGVSDGMQKYHGNTQGI